MINRGVGGEEISDMLKRFDQAVVANKPDLVLWQLGTNALLRGHRITDGRGMMGGYQAVMINPETGMLLGGSDLRKDGLAIGW